MLTLTMSQNATGDYVAEVSGIPLGPGDYWTRQAEQRRLAVAELQRRIPDAVVMCSATSSATSYVLWFRRIEA